MLNPEAKRSACLLPLGLAIVGQLTCACLAEGVPADHATCAAVLGVDPRELALAQAPAGDPFWPARVVSYRFTARPVEGAAVSGTISVDTLHRYVVTARYDPGKGVVGGTPARMAIEDARAMALAFAQRALGVWSGMQLTQTIVAPAQNPTRYAFTWEQSDDQGRITGTQAGVTVSIAEGAVVSYAGRVAPPNRPRPVLRGSDAEEAAARYLGQMGYAAEGAEKRLVLSWLRAPDEGPVWMVVVRARPVWRLAGRTKSLVVTLVVDACQGTILAVG